MVAALGGLSDHEDELGNHWVPCNDDPYASATLETDEACISCGSFHSIACLFIFHATYAAPRDESGSGKSIVGRLR